MTGLSNRAAEPGGRTPVGEQGADAIALLRDDHHQLGEWFKDYDSAGSNARKLDLATRICGALRVHLALEEELFFPALLHATNGSVAYDAAVHDHADAQRLIEQILESSPVDELFDSRIRILGDVVSQCIAEEESPGGVFAEAAQADLDLRSLGLALHRRRHALQGEAE